MRSSGLVELEAVAAVARRGGFRAAALELGMSSSALSQAVAGLERRLGVRLFNRTTRSVSLTSAGQQFVGEIAPALAAIQSAMAGGDRHRDAPSGVLRLNAALGAARMIQPLVFEYLRRWPQMQVEVATEGRLIDIVAAGFDAGLRLIDVTPGDMVAVPISRSMRSVVAGSPDYFRRHGRPATPGDLANHRCIRARMASGAIYRWEFERRGETLTLDVPGPLILDEGGLMVEAALAGVGLAYLSEASMAEPLADGRLEIVLEDWTPPYPGLALYYPGRRLTPPKLRAFIDLIRETAKD